MAKCKAIDIAMAMKRLFRLLVFSRILSIGTLFIFTLGRLEIQAHY